MQLQFSGAKAAGPLRALGEFRGFFRGGAGRLGMSRVAVEGEGGLVCHGIGSFMALDPPRGLKMHPVPHRDRASPEPARLDEKALHADERRILARADAALAAGGAFIDNFWGIHPHGGKAALAVGLHVGNRVGHAQGGILVGLASATAASALPPNFSLSGVSAWYISPGDAKTLRAFSTVIHQGRLTAVVSTRVTGKNRQLVLDVVSTHKALSQLR
jgi:acyl-coenzyme A thioesterase PaaI-like protein